MPAGRLCLLLGLALVGLITALVLLSSQTDLLVDYPGVRIGFSVAIAGVIALAAKDVGERVRARRADRTKG